MKFGYLRVSRNEQSLDIQIQKLKLAGCEEIFMEKVTGVKEEREELKRFL
jgi:DNA invertase Pin-like site-specific DNA recombinase